MYPLLRALFALFQRDCESTLLSSGTLCFTAVKLYLCFFDGMLQHNTSLPRCSSELGPNVSMLPNRGPTLRMRQDASNGWWGLRAVQPAPGAPGEVRKGHSAELQVHMSPVVLHTTCGLSPTLGSQSIVFVAYLVIGRTRPHPAAGGQRLHDCSALFSSSAASAGHKRPRATSSQHQSTFTCPSLVVQATS